MSVKLNVGVIGTGWVATARHIPALQRDRRAVLAAVFDPRIERARDVARHIRKAQAFDVLDEFLERPLDAVSICAPPHAHAELIDRSLRAGKHVLVEKPFTLTSREGRELQALAERSGLVLCPAHNLLFARSAQRASARVASGDAGDIVSAMGVQISSWRRRLPTWFDDLPGGLFFDEAPHLLYLMRHFLGELRVENAWVENGASAAEVPMQRTEARLRGKLGAGYLTMWSGAPLSEWYLILFCTRAVMVIDLFRDILIDLPPEDAHNSKDVVGAALRGTLQLWTGTASSGVRFLRGNLFYGHDRLVARFLDATEGKSEPPVTAEDGWRVVELIEDILRRADAQ